MCVLSSAPFIGSKLGHNLQTSFNNNANSLVQDPSNLFHQLNRRMPLGLERGSGWGWRCGGVWWWERLVNSSAHLLAWCGRLADFCAPSEFVINNELHLQSISKCFFMRRGDNLGITGVFDKKHTKMMCFYSSLCSHKQMEWPISFVINLQHNSPLRF